MTPRGSASALPDFWPAEDLARRGIQPLGEEAAMRAAFAEAMTFIEIHPAAWGAPATRLSLPAIRARFWSVIPCFMETGFRASGDDDDRRLADAVRAWAKDGVAGIIVVGPNPAPSIVWHVPPSIIGVRSLWMCHKGMETLMLPPDRGFALFGDGEQLVILAGPPDFLRAAVPHPAAMHRDITAHAAEMDRINGHSHNTDMLRHYAPVTIDH